MIKIGFDAKRAIQNNTGLGNYSRYIIEILSRFFEDNDYLLYAPKERENVRLNDLKSSKNVFFRFPVGGWKHFSSFWRTWGITKWLKKDQIEIYHGLSNELPLRINRSGIKTVVSIHDLIFLRYPGYYKPIDRFIYRLKFRYAAKIADKVIAISECTKRDIISFFHIPEEKISVVYQGCHPNFSQKVSSEKKEDIIRKYALPSRFLLYVGSIEERKNLLLAVKALKHVHEDIHLVAVGKSTWYQDEVEKYASNNQLSGRLHIYNNVSFEDLPSFYQLANLFIYPSRYEGFGIPIIEALISGTPTIAAKGSCLEEAGGESSLYVNPDDEKELAEKINLVLSDAGLASQMSEQGKKYSERFSDKVIADNIMDVYKSVLI